MSSYSHKKELDNMSKVADKTVKKLKNRENNLDVVLHVGLHKTATTFLQEEVFPKLEGVNYTNLSGIYADIGQGEEHTSRGTLEAPVDEDKINLISREGYSGYPYEVDRGINADIRRRIAHSLTKLFPDARILIGVRNKEDWMQSLYRQYSKMRPDTTSFEMFKDKFDDRYADFDGYISLLQSLFSDVYVYRYEHLKEDYESFVDDICSWIGVPTPEVKNIVYNKGWSQSQIELTSAMYSIARKAYMAFRYLMELSNREKK